MTLPLNTHRWADAQLDLAHAVELEAQQSSGAEGSEAWRDVDPSTLNNLGGCL